MIDTDAKGVHQLLLSPLFLLYELIAIVIPGLVLLALLGLKGNKLLYDAWVSPHFGYKTKITMFLVLGYIIGSILRAPIILLQARKTKPSAEFTGWLKTQPREVQTLVSGAITQGAILSTPGLVDRLSVLQTRAAFHVGTGIALITASCISGDGRPLRLLEFSLGVLMCCAGIILARAYSDETLRMIGVGFASLLGRLTEPQIKIFSAVTKSVFGNPNPPVVTTATVVTTPPSGAATSAE
jgi:hypothetical protein